MSKNEKNLNIYKVDAETFMPLPYADGGIKAGFPSPAQDYISQAIDLNKELIHHPACTFYGRISGDMAVCCIDGKFTVKRARIEIDAVWLVPSNPDYPLIKAKKNIFNQELL